MFEKLRLRCIDNEGHEDTLVIGQEYEAERITVYENDIVRVAGVTYTADRFAPLDPAPPAGSVSDELDRLRSELLIAKRDIERLTDPELRDMRLANGQIDLAVAGPIVERMAVALTAQFRAGGAQNYMEMSIVARDESMDRFIVTVQRAGAKTPHELRAQAEAERDEARAALAAQPIRTGSQEGDGGKLREELRLVSRFAKSAWSLLEQLNPHNLPGSLDAMWIALFEGPRQREIMDVARQWAALSVPASPAGGQVPEGYDLVAHLERQRAFSLRTFGPGKRTGGVCDHIRKELREIKADPEDADEWVDVVLLGLDGLWRSGVDPAEAARRIEAKQTKNEGRNWPDWRTMSADKAIEHDRSGEAPPPPADQGGAS